MNKLFLLAALSAMQFTVAAQTNISGIIGTNTSWTKANSPYIIDDNLLIDKGITLNIEPGVVVKTEIHKNIYIDGNLIANGTAADPIRFISTMQGTNSMDAWYGLQFRGSNTDTALFKYCEFKNCHSAIRSDKTSLIIENTSFMEVYVGVQADYSDYLLVKNSNFNKMSSSVIANTAYGDVNNNRILVCATVGIQVSGTTVKIADNYLDHGEGIRAEGQDIEVENNTVLKAFYGIQIPSTTANTVVTGNTIAYCTLAMVLRQAKGSFTNNTLVHNNKGLTLALLSNQDIAFNNNCVYDNKEYNVFLEDATDTIDLSNNWWGTTDSAKINDKVYDWYDNFTKPGIVHFYPYITQAPDGCKNAPFPTSVAEINTTPTHTVYPNPFYSTFTVAPNDELLREVIVYNVTGKKIASVKAEGKKEVTIDLSQHPAGMYIYQGVYNDNTSFSGKLVKE